MPGLGHDLWKSQDAIALGIVHGMATSGDLVVPRIAGTSWLYDQPLFHWIALAFGSVLRLVMEFAVAARVASGALLAVALALIYRAARDWSDDVDTRRTTASAALLILLGSIGLLVHAHEALPELAALAAMCGALAALPQAREQPLRRGALFGVALGLAFLAAAWTAPVALAAAAFLAHGLCPQWRTRRAVLFIAAALICGVLVAATWPAMLALRSHGAFVDWWSIEWRPYGSRGENLRHFFGTASWFAWPAWPLAAWSAWSLRRRLLEPRLFVPAAALVIATLLAILWGPPEDELLVPLLAPLALLAAHGIFTLRRGAVAALDWFGVLTFAFFAGLVWVGYLAMLTGVPGPVARNFARAAPGFVAHVNALGVVVAVILLVAWVYIAFFIRFSPMRSIVRWAAGIVLLWGTFAMLWMPWVDYQKTYRGVAHALREKLPKGACVAQRSLGVSQAAALDYYGGIRATRFEAMQPGACRYVIVQGSPNHELDAPAAVGGARWTKLADVGRPGDRAERYRLYRFDR